MSYTDQEKLDAIDRELKYRRRVYPRLIEQHKISPSFANFQIGVFEAIREDYKERVQAGELGLFDDD